MIYKTIIVYTGVYKNIYVYNNIYAMHGGGHATYATYATYKDRGQGALQTNDSGPLQQNHN